MPVGMHGVIISANAQPVVAGNATAGGATTLQDTAKDFIALGIAAGDNVIITDGPGGLPSQRTTILAVVDAQNLNINGVATPLAADSHYMIVRGTFVRLGGKCRIRHERRLPVKDVPGKAGDVVQDLNRKSRRVMLPGNDLYRGDLNAAVRDTFHLVDAVQLRSWHDAGTGVYFSSLTESALLVKFEYLEVEESQGKGFIIEALLVEAT